ncbi:MAG: hypothetical protein ACREF3_19790 [Acetobacteraceae bacterium]
MRATGSWLIAALFAAALSGVGAAAVPPETQPWPHTRTINGASITIYQPQAEAWPDQRTLDARAAVAITPQGASKPILGTVDVSVATTTDNATRMVRLSDPKLTATRFPSLDTQRAAALDAKLRAALPQMQLAPVPLDTVLLSLKQETAPTNVAVSNDPPVVYYSERPASLVVFDGEPVLAPLGSTGLSFAVNTNWDVFVDHGTWYLLNDVLWLSAPAATGPYKPAARLPAAFNAIPHDTSFAAVRQQIPPKPVPVADKVPTIFVSTRPAEIVVTAGPPQFAAVPGTPLQRVSNTGATLFFDPADHLFYILISGRWFSASGLHGPWSFASDKLPAEFAMLPDQGGDAAVLASVPGTAQAQDAALRAQIPQTATLKKGSAKLAVSYAGAPQFTPIPGTGIEYATNTVDQVLKAGDRYYACYQGAWFVAASPNGPWVLADSVPKAVYAIPPSSPMYNVTYVQVYGSTPQTVTYGYTSGYMMGFLTAGLLVYGTGYYYPPVVVPGRVPIYYPYPYTYAGNVWYNSATGGWARGGSVYGPYYGASAGRYYNPTTGGWAHGAAVYGPYGGAGAWSSYNPHTGTYAHGSAVWGGGSGTANASFYNPRYGVSGSTNQNVNPYGRWGSSTVSGPNQTVSTESGRNAHGSAGAFNSSSGASGAAYHNRATGNSGAAVNGANGNVYAGRDGNVYQHTDSGWSKWNNGGWNPVTPPANDSRRTSGTQSGSLGATQPRVQGGNTQFDRSNYQQLERDRVGREAGASRYSGGQFGGGRFRR